MRSPYCRFLSSVFSPGSDGPVRPVELQIIYPIHVQSHIINIANSLFVAGD